MNELYIPGWKPWFWTLLSVLILITGPVCFETLVAVPVRFFQEIVTLVEHVTGF